jgi:hypothetical protein
MIQQATQSRALVSAGGGVAGIAWEFDVLLGIRNGAAMLSPAVVDESVRLAAVRGRLFDRTSGVGLVDAVASCASFWGA